MDCILPPLDRTNGELWWAR